MECQPRIWSTCNACPGEVKVNFQTFKLANVCIQRIMSAHGRTVRTRQTILCASTLEVVFVDCSPVGKTLTAQLRLTC